MAINEGDKVPAATFKVMGEDGPQDLTSNDLFTGKTVALFSLPGAFTPTCSAKHLPGFVQNADALKGKGVDTIVCTAANDVFVMAAWGKDQNVGDKVVMAADGSADFAKALGLELDLGARGMGMRAQRYSMIVKDGIVAKLNVEAPGAFEVSSAEHMLGEL
ncbi:MAG: peroxiredoxin [Alphaproteobacteria bacterium]|jgi:peroxiredoxin